MSYLKLIKLLYLADRKALLELGRPISGDRFCSLDKGPILSQTLNLIREEQNPADPPSYWREYVSSPEQFEVRLLKEAPNDQLSDAEEQILDAIFKEYGHMSRWELVDFSHTLPEYRDPKGSSINIRLSDILIGQGMTLEEAKAVEAEIDASSQAESLTE